MKYALIAGAAGGLATTVIHAIKKDFHIFALDCSPRLLQQDPQDDQIESFLCDITDENQLQQVKEKILMKTDHLDLIINFAGMVVLGSAVEIKPDILEKTLQVNVLGMYRVNYCFFSMLEKKKSRIINVSSEYGRLLALPFHSFYTMSKHAVEMYSDSLRRELKVFSIPVIKIRPGSFQTNMQKNVTNQFNELLQETHLFKRPLLRMKKLMDGELKKAKNSQKIVGIFKKAIFSKRPKKVYRANNSLKMKILSALPPFLQDFILYQFFH